MLCPAGLRFRKSQSAIRKDNVKSATPADPSRQVDWTMVSADTSASARDAANCQPRRCARGSRRSALTASPMLESVQAAREGDLAIQIRSERASVPFPRQRLPRYGLLRLHRPLFGRYRAMPHLGGHVRERQRIWFGFRRPASAPVITPVGPPPGQATDSQQGTRDCQFDYAKAHGSPLLTNARLVRPAGEARSPPRRSSARTPSRSTCRCRGRRSCRRSCGRSYRCSTRRSSNRSMHTSRRASSRCS